MSASQAGNLAYLKSLTAQLEQIPHELARAAGFHVFQEMVRLSIDVGGFDSGQAAANWRMTPMFNGVNRETQKMLWGYGDTAPVDPVGYKSRYGEPGNREKVRDWLFNYSLDQYAAAPKGLTGFSIYNPIEPGFAGFEPGDDSKYFKNALSLVAQRAHGSAAQVGVYFGEQKVKMLFPRLF